MIESITLRAGANPGAPSLHLTLSPVTIFVGPNNSGKSATLREIEYLCRNGQKNPLHKIMSELKMLPHSEDEAAEFVNTMLVPQNSDEYLSPDQVKVGGANNAVILGRQEAITTVSSKHNEAARFAQWFLTNRTIRLDGPSRIALCNDQSAGNLILSPTTTFGRLFLNDKKREEISQIVYEGVGQYLIVDPTELGRLKLRLSQRKPTDPSEERGLDDRALNFQRAAFAIQEASDGVKAYVGMIIELLIGDPLVALIDEPEAFLHPALAFKLGQVAAHAAMTESKRVIVATHSAAFLMGCIESHVPINIIRLTHEKSIPTSRLLSSQTVVGLMRNPLLRSTNILNALFFENVIVTEADTDRAFYQQINERLLQFESFRGVRNCLFINAQNKQTVASIVEPLRKLGIAAAAIVDVDIFKANAGEWRMLSDAIGIPDSMRQPISVMLNSIEKNLLATGKDMKRDGGINLLNGEALDTAKEFLHIMERYGLFVVSHGELESWLAAIAVPGHGPFWLIEMFKRMGDDPSSPAYVKPQSGDVWDFIHSVQKWLSEPNRKGILAA